MTRDDLLDGLPEPWPEDPLPDLREAILKSGHTIVVLDDDPTGTQTVYDVPVITRLDAAAITASIAKHPPLLFLLTNSRSLTHEETVSLHERLGAIFASTENITVISRSDSTLRGHYPAETDALQRGMGLDNAITLLVPFFEAGGRITVGDQHVVVEGDRALPASETPFARDPVFGYRSSHLPSYVEEKTGGRIAASKVRSLSLSLIRTGGPHAVATALCNCQAGAVCIANAVSQRDAEVIAAGAQLAEKNGQQIISRTAASYVQARAGLPSREPLSASNLSTDSANGGLIVVGSHVPKTNAQLKVLLENTPDWIHLELSVPDIFADDSKSDLNAFSEQMSRALSEGRNVVLYTSRELVTAAEDKANLDISCRVSSALVHITSQLPRPGFLIAKGGITSSDLATKALQVTTATVVGAILPGIPVWRLGPESRHPGLTYVPFPGNTGSNDALWKAAQKLTL